MTYRRLERHVVARCDHNELMFQQTKKSQPKQAESEAIREVKAIDPANPLVSLAAYLALNKSVLGKKSGDKVTQTAKGIIEYTDDRNTYVKCEVANGKLSQLQLTYRNPNAKDGLPLIHLLFIDRGKNNYEISYFASHNATLATIDPSVAGYVGLLLFASDRQQSKFSHGRFHAEDKDARHSTPELKPADLDENLEWLPHIRDYLIDSVLRNIEQAAGLEKGSIAGQER